MSAFYACDANAHIDEYSNNDASRYSVSKALGNTLAPLYQIAMNHGYQAARYEGHHSYFVIDI